MLPYRVRPTGCTETTSADTYMSHLNYTFCFLDGLVIANSCDNIRRLYDILREKRPYPFIHFISIPHKAGSGGAMNWYKDEVTHFQENIESVFGIKISGGGTLNDAIDVYNETRSLLSKIRAF